MPDAPQANAPASAAAPAASSAPVAAPANSSATVAAVANPAPAAVAATPAPAVDPAAAAVAKPGDAAPASLAKETVKAVVPEKYDFKAPEGVTLDTDIVGALEATAKELQLPQEAAQKVFDLGVKHAQKMQEAFAASVAQAQADWRKASEIDPEFGGDKLDENRAIAKLALKGASPKLIEFLEQTKLGDHPEIFRWMLRVGRQFSSDTFVAGKPTAQAGDPDAARAARLYGATAQQ